MFYSEPPSFVLGFHGCSKTTAEKVLAGKEHLKAATNDYDWLGHGIYFWEQDPDRAMDWARSKPRIKKPAVVGAIIDLGHCLSLMRQDHIDMLTDSHRALREVFKSIGKDLPENTIGADKLRRELDCAVINQVHTLTDNSFQTVRGIFTEGKPAYLGAAFNSKNHVQICVRSRKSIKGYFRPIT